MQICFSKYLLLDGMEDAYFKGYTQYFCQMFLGLRLFQSLEYKISGPSCAYLVWLYFVTWKRGQFNGREWWGNLSFALASCEKKPRYIATARTFNSVKKIFVIFLENLKTKGVEA